MLIMIVAVDGNVCKPTASTAIIISAKADCCYLLGTLALSALELREGYLGRVSPHRNKLRPRHYLGDGLAVRAARLVIDIKNASAMKHLHFILIGLLWVIFYPAQQTNRRYS